MALPNFQSSLPEFNLMQSQWGSQLNPVVNNPIVKGLQLQNVQLGAGANVINHKLGRKLQGWIVTRIRAASALYDTQDANQMPELTLQLNASAPVIVDLWVY